MSEFKALLDAAIGSYGRWRVSIVCDKPGDAHAHASDYDEARAAVEGHVAHLESEIVRISGCTKEWWEKALARTQELTAAHARIAKLEAALQFYADPDTYFACGFAFDPPCGEFSDDFSEDHSAEFTDRLLPGKRARTALAAHDTPEGE